MQKDMFQKKKPKKNMDLEKLTIFIQVVKKNL